MTINFGKASLICPFNLHHLIPKSTWKLTEIDTWAPTHGNPWNKNLIFAPLKACNDPTRTLPGWGEDDRDVTNDDLFVSEKGS